jgi:hypothetical protein
MKRKSKVDAKLLASFRALPDTELITKLLGSSRDAAPQITPGDFRDSAVVQVLLERKLMEVEIDGEYECVEWTQKGLALWEAMNAAAEPAPPTEPGMMIPALNPIELNKLINALIPLALPLGPDGFDEPVSVRKGLLLAIWHTVAEIKNHLDKRPLGRAPRKIEFEIPAENMDSTAKEIRTRLAQEGIGQLDNLIESYAGDLDEEVYGIYFEKLQDALW